MSRYLITGGTGSFGSTMVERLLTQEDVQEVVVFSRDEKKQYDMRQKMDSEKLRFVVGDVRDKNAVKQALIEIDYVFHAAALKQVPTGEFFPSEVIKTNILGSQNVLDAAEEVGTVKKVVVLSTDKAVYPINAMGISKAMVEKLVIAKAQRSLRTNYCVVRYGNVMASRGSVIPLFLKQIQQNKKLTVTNPNMTRFLLSLDDAIELVLFAMKEGNQGDIFIKKAPAATVHNLARAMIELFESKKDIELIGTREGEKLHETLATKFELTKSDDMGDYYRIKHLPATNTDGYFEEGYQMKIKNDYDSESTQQLNMGEVKQLLQSLPFIKNNFND